VLSRSSGDEFLTDGEFLKAGQVLVESKDRCFGP
jgi:hypothetical protein